MSSYSVGLRGEKLAARELRRAGYKVSRPDEVCKGDLLCIDESGRRLFVEVKTSRRGINGSYHATLRKSWQGRQCATFDADFLLFQLLLPAGLVVRYLVPHDAVGERRVIGVVNPFSDRSWLAPYRVKSAFLRLDLPDLVSAQVQ